MSARTVVSTIALGFGIAIQMFAGTIANTGTPNNQIGVASRPDAGGLFEIETGDDFITATPVNLVSGTFTGLLVGSVAVPTVQDIGLEIYRVFPNASDTGRLPNVTTRANSPSDVAFTTYSSSTDFSFTTQVLAQTFSTLNSIQPGGIHPFPNQTTGGNGGVTGQEVQFNFTFIVPAFLPADHFFFVPQVQVDGGTFYWLSADRPLIVPPDVATVPDLQAWTRDTGLDPDWSRVGSDIVGPGPQGLPAPTFNMAFSLNADAVPEPSTFGLCLGALGLLGWAKARKSRMRK